MPPFDVRSVGASFPRTDRARPSSPIPASAAQRPGGLYIRDPAAAPANPAGGVDPWTDHTPGALCKAS